MSTNLHLGHLRKGDIIKSRRTVEVVAVASDDEFDDGTYVFQDVQSGQEFFVEYGSDQGSWHFNMVKKAAPTVGDEIGGRYVHDALPVGTVVRDEHGFYGVKVKHPQRGEYWVFSDTPQTDSLPACRSTIVALPA